MLLEGNNKCRNLDLNLFPPKNSALPSGRKVVYDQDLTSSKLFSFRCPRSDLNSKNSLFRDLQNQT